MAEHIDPSEYLKAVESQKSYTPSKLEQATVPGTGFQGPFNPNKNEAGLSPGTMPELQALRATNQSGWDQAFNGTVGGLLSGLGTAAEGVGYIADAVNIPQRLANSIFEIEGMDRNILSEAGKGLKDWANDAMPIYQQEGEWNMSDPGFYWSSLKGVLDSAVGFAIPGGIASKAASMALRSARLGSYLGTLGANLGAETALGKAITMASGKAGQNVIQSGLAGYLSNYAESKMMGLEVYEQTIANLEPLVKEGKLSEQRAKQIAGEQAEDFMWKNKVFMLSDAFALHGVFNGQGLTRGAFTKETGKTLMKEAAKQAPMEGLEEIGQNVLQSEDIYGGKLVGEGEAGIGAKGSMIDRKDNPYGFYNRVLESATSYQALYEGMLGFISGPAQSIGGKKLSLLMDRANINKQQEIQQASVDANKADVEQMFAAQSDIAKAKAEAIANGDITEASFADDVLWSNVKKKAYETGTADIVENQLKEISTSETASQEDKDKAGRLLSDLKQSETQWLRYSDSPVRGALFLAEENEKALTNARADYDRKRIELVGLQQEFMAGKEQKLDKEGNVIEPEYSTEEQGINLEIERYNNTINSLDENLFRIKKEKAFLKTKEGVKQAKALAKQQEIERKNADLKNLETITQEGTEDLAKQAREDAKKSNAAKDNIKPEEDALKKTNEVINEMGGEPLPEQPVPVPPPAGKQETPSSGTGKMPNAPKGDSVAQGDNGKSYNFINGVWIADEGSNYDQSDFEAVDAIQAKWSADGNPPFNYSKKPIKKDPKDDPPTGSGGSLVAEEEELGSTDNANDAYNKMMIQRISAKLANAETIEEAGLTGEEKDFANENPQVIRDAVKLLLDEKKTKSELNDTIIVTSGPEQSGDQFDEDDKKFVVAQEEAMAGLSNLHSFNSLQYLTMRYEKGPSGSHYPSEYESTQEAVKNTIKWDLLLDPSVVKPGTTVTLVPTHDSQDPIYISSAEVEAVKAAGFGDKVQIVTTVKDKVQKYSIKWKDFASYLESKYGKDYRTSDLYIDHIPVQAVINGNLAAHLGSPNNLYAGLYGNGKDAITALARDRKALRDVKAYLIKANSVQVKVKEVTDGYFFKSKVKNKATVLGNDVQVGICKDGKSITVKNGKDIKPTLGEMRPDVTYAIIPGRNGKTYAYPVSNTALGSSLPEFVDTAMTIVDICLGIEHPLSKDNDRIAREIKDTTGYDIRTFKGVKEYLSNFLLIHTLSKTNRIEDKKPGVNRIYLGIATTAADKEKGSEIAFRMGKDQVFHLSRYTPDDVKVNLRKTLKNAIMSSYSNFNLEKASSNYSTIPTISKEGVVGKLGEYNEVYRRVIETNLSPVTLSNGKKAYFGQPQVVLDLGGMLKSAASSKIARKATAVKTATKASAPKVNEVPQTIATELAEGTRRLLVSDSPVDTSKPIVTPKGNVILNPVGNSKITINQLNTFLKTGSLDTEGLINEIINGSDKLTRVEGKNLLTGEKERYYMRKDQVGMKESEIQKFQTVTTSLNEPYVSKGPEEDKAAQDAGLDVDAVVRDFFSGKDMHGMDYYLSSAAYNSLIETLEKMKADYDSKGLRVVSTNLFIMDYQELIAGEMDLLLVDKNGNFHIRDMKVSRGYNSKKYESGEDTRRFKHQKQLNRYAIILNNTYGIKVASLGTILFKVTRETGSPIIENISYVNTEPLELKKEVSKTSDPKDPTAVDSPIARRASAADKLLGSFAPDFKTGKKTAYVYIPEIEVTQTDNVKIDSSFIIDGMSDDWETTASSEDEDNLPPVFAEQKYTKGLAGMSKQLLIAGVPLAIQTEFVEQLTFAWHKALVDNKVSTNKKAQAIFRDLSESSKKNVTAVNEKVTAAKGENNATAKYSKALLSNWSKLENLVKDRMLSLNGAKKSYIQQGDGESANVRNNYSENFVFELNDKRSLSAKVRKFLSFVPAYERRGDKFVKSPNKVFANQDKYMNFDTVFNTLQGELSGTKPSFDAMIAHLESKSGSIPWYKDVINGLKNADNQIKNQFVSTMYRHENNMTYVYFGYDKDGRVKAGLGYDNSSSIEAAVRAEWDYNLLSVRKLITKKETGELIIKSDNAYIEELRNQYLAWVKDYTDNGNVPEHKDFISYMSKLGIIISPKTVLEMEEHGWPRGSKLVMYEDLFRSRNVDSPKEMSRLVLDVLDRLTVPKGEKEIDIRNRRPLDLPVIKDLAKFETKFNDRVFANSMRVSGKPLNVHILDQYVFSRSQELKDLEKLKVLSGLTYSKMDMSNGREIHTSKMLDDLINDETYRNDVFKIETISIDSLREEGRKRFGDNSLARQPEANHELVKVMMFQRTKRVNNNNYVSLFYPTQSDKERMVAYTFKKFDIGKGLTSDNKLLKEVYEQLVRYLVAPDFNRMTSTSTPDIKGYNEGKNLFYTIPELNFRPELFNNDGSVRADIFSNPNLYDVVLKAVTDHVDTKADEIYYSWQEMGIIGNSGDITSFLDKDYIDSLTGDEYDAGSYAAYDYFINNIVGTQSIHQLILGDPALYYESKSVNKATSLQLIKEFKATALTAMGVGMDENSTDEDYQDLKVRTNVAQQRIMSAIKETFTNIGKRTAGDIAPGAIGNIDGFETYKQVFLQDPVAKSIVFDYLEKLGVAEKYAKIDIADGQEVTTFEEFINVMYIYGKITDEQRDRLINDEKKSQLSDEDIEFITSLDNGPNVMKPVYVGNHIVDDVDKRIYIKASSFPLIRQMVRGSELETLLDMMLKHKVQRAAYNSAVKVGNFRKTADIFERNADGTITGTFTINEEEFLKSVENMDRKNFRIQQDLPFDPLYDQVNRFTQASKLAFLNMLSSGEANAEITTPFQYKGSEYNAKELSDIHNSLYEKLFLANREELENQIFSKGKLDLRKLQEILVEEAEQRDYPLNDMLGLDLTVGIGGKPEFRIPLWASSSSDRYESLLNSIVNNRVLKATMPGHSFILGSEVGIKSRRILEGVEGLKELSKINGVIYTKHYDPNGPLHPGSVVENEDGTVTVRPAQVLIPNRFKGSDGKLLDLTKLLNKDGVIDTDKLPEELLMKFGIRIPYQGPSSGSLIQVVGFLPITVGDLVIAPQDFVQQMGSDFDVDKLYTYMLNYSQEPDGKLVPWNLDVEFEKYRQKWAQSPKMRKLAKQLAAASNPSPTTTSLGDLINSDMRAMLMKGIKEEFNDGSNKDFTTDEILEILEAEGIEPDREAFVKRTRKYEFQNDIVKLHLAIYENPDAFIQRQVKAPLPYGPLPEYAEYFEQYQDQSTTFSPMSPDYQRRKYLNATVGKAAVGVFSSDSVLNALLQQGDIKLKYGADENFYFSLGAKNDENVSPEKRSRLENKDGSLSGLYTIDGNKRLKSDQITWLQSVALDNEKLQALGRLNVNNQTYDAIRAANLLGFPIERMLLLLNQPIIKDYIASVNKFSGVTNQEVGSTKMLALREVMNKYSSKVSGYISKDEDPTFLRGLDNDYFSKLNDTEFRALIEEEESYPNFFAIQLVALDKFNTLSSKGEDLKLIQTLIGTDSAGLGTSYLETLLKEKALIKVSEMTLAKDRIEGLENIFGEVLTFSEAQTRFNNNNKRAAEKGFYSVGNSGLMIKPRGIIGSSNVHGILFNNKLWEDVLPYNNKDVREELDVIIDNMSRSNVTSIDAQVELQQEVWSHAKSYLYSNRRMNFTEEELKIERKRLLYNADGNVPLTEVVNIIRNTTLLDNPILNALMMGTPRNGNDPMTLRFSSAVAEGYDETRYYQGFMNLLTDDTTNLGVFNGITYTPRLLAQDLILSAYLTGGIQAAVQYTKYVPLPYFDIAGTSQYLRSLSFKSNTFGRSDKFNVLSDGEPTPSIFERQLAQHMPKQYPTPRKGKFDYISDYNDEIDNILYEKALAEEGYEAVRNWEDNPKIGPVIGIRITQEYQPQFFHIVEKSSKQVMLFEKIAPNLYLRIPILGSFNNREYQYNTASAKSLVNNFESIAFDISYRFQADQVNNFNTVTDEYLPDEIDNTLNSPPALHALNRIISDGAQAKESTSDRQYALIAAALAQNFKKFGNLKTVKTGTDAARGKYVASTNTVYISRTANTSANTFKNTFLHEMLHAATKGAILEYYTAKAEKRASTLTPNQESLIMSLERLQEYAINEMSKRPRWSEEFEIFKEKIRSFESKFTIEKGSITSDELSRNYGFAKLSEFITMAMTDKEFQKLLNEMEYNESKTFLDRLKDWMTLFLKSLGLEVNPNSVLAQAIHDIIDLVTDPADTTYSTSTSEANALQAITILSTATDDTEMISTDEYDEYSSIPELAGLGLSATKPVLTNRQKYGSVIEVSKSKVTDENGIKDALFNNSTVMLEGGNLEALSFKIPFLTEDMYIKDEFGFKYPSIYHYVHAMAFTDKADRVVFTDKPVNRSTYYPVTQVKALYSKQDRRVRENWANLKYDNLMSALKHKFSFKYYQDHLLATKDSPELYYVPEYADAFYAMYPIGDMYKGQNVLGKMLTDIRAELLANQTPEEAAATPVVKPIPLNTSKTPEFDKLPSKSDTLTMTYAGIGSRETPPEVLKIMSQVAEQLESYGFTLRSGAAKGADSAFESGVKSKKEIFPGNVKTGERELKIAREIHPNPIALDNSKNPEFIWNLMGRNTNQIFGKNLDTPVDFVLAYTKDGITDGSKRTVATGGTGQAIDLASRKGIPVINLANANWQQDLNTLLKSLQSKQPVKAEPAAPVKSVTPVTEATPTSEWKKFIEMFLAEFKYVVPKDTGLKLGKFKKDPKIEPNVIRFDLGLSAKDRASIYNYINGRSTSGKAVTQKFYKQIAEILVDGNIPFIQGVGGTTTRTGIPIDEYIERSEYPPINLVMAMEAAKVFVEGRLKEDLQEKINLESNPVKIILEQALTAEDNAVVDQVFEENREGDETKEQFVERIMKSSLAGRPLGLKTKGDLLTKFKRILKKIFTTLMFIGVLNFGQNPLADFLARNDLVSREKTVFVTDLLGIDSKITEKSFNDDQKKLLEDLIKKAEAQGKSSVTYADYPSGSESVEFTKESAIVGASAEAVVKRTLGQFTFEKLADGTYAINDQFNFNDSMADKSFADKFSHIVDKFGDESLSTYGKIRSIGTAFGSKEGEGANVSILLASNTVSETDVSMLPDAIENNQGIVSLDEVTEMINRCKA
jgi:predicted NAD-dependent protein-ADP-ribosyltransferase YbiA (DUF1768 family)